MDSYRIEWKKSAVKELKRIDKSDIPAILEGVIKIQENPFSSDIRKLTGSEHTFRKRIGNFRIIYSISNKEQLIEIVRVRHRKDVYG